MIGTSIGNYLVVDRLSEGGMGTIYRAKHHMIDRWVAIKVLQPELSRRRDIVARFFNEARATSAIQHKGIVEVFDFGYMDGRDAYLVMELLDGVTLTQRLQSRGRLSEGEAAIYLRGVCSALAAAHAKGIVHRDLKPDNVFLVVDPDSPLGERTKLLDFGIAKLIDKPFSGNVTNAGQVMGTPTYMSPEQCRDTCEVDHRADLYSIGCIYYELVAGRPPFVSTSAGELLGAHQFVTPEPITRHAAVSHDVAALVMSLLEKDPARRIQTAGELTALLTAVAQRATPRMLGSAVGLEQPYIAPAMAPRSVATPDASTAVLAPATVTGASGESAARERPRSWWALAIGAGALTIAVLAAVMTLRPGSRERGGDIEPAHESSAIDVERVSAPERAPSERAPSEHVQSEPAPPVPPAPDAGAAGSSAPIAPAVEPTIESPPPAPDDGSAASAGKPAIKPPGRPPRPRGPARPAVPKDELLESDL